MGRQERYTVVDNWPEDLDPKQNKAYQIICNHIDGIIEGKVNKTSNTSQFLLSIQVLRAQLKAFGSIPSGIMLRASPSFSRISLCQQHHLELQPFLLVVKLCIFSTFLRQHQLSSHSLESAIPFSCKTQICWHMRSQMIGQRVFYYVSKHQQEGMTKTADQPFSGISIMLLRDFKQLPPVLNSFHYQDQDLSVLRGKVDVA